MKITHDPHDVSIARDGRFNYKNGGKKQTVVSRRVVFLNPDDALEIMENGAYPTMVAVETLSCGHTIVAPTPSTRCCRMPIITKTDTIDGAKDHSHQSQNRLCPFC